jgi:transposase-like protein/predicted kinase
MLTVVPDDCPGQQGGKDHSPSLIDEIVREGARWMLAEALRAEVDAYVAAFAAERDENGRRQVVRNGYHRSREVLTSAGAIEVTVPRVNDKRTGPDTGERLRFCSAILPPWARKTPKVTVVLPLLYLHGLSSGDFVPALGQFLGPSAGLSAPVVTKLTETWKAGQHAFAARDLSHVDHVYLRVDGIHVNIRLEEHKLCLLLMIGVRADGRKELVALADGYRESAESWADLLRDCARRGMRAPALAIGDGALGFWNGLREVFPQTREGRCWFHKTANGLAALPEFAHPGAKKALAEIWGAEDKDHARAAVKAFEAAYGAKFPKAVAKIAGDLDQLLAFYDYPAGHWVHLRTTNPIEPAFATVRHRTTVTKGPGSRAAGPGHGIQADRSRARPLARRRRTPPRRPGPRRSHVHRRQAHRTPGKGRSVNEPDPPSPPGPGTVIVLTGPPGSGKSTMARLLAGSLPSSVHLHSDDFWHYIRQGRIAPYLLQAHRQNQTVIDALAQAASAHAAGGYQVICDGIVGPWFINVFRTAAARAVSLHYVTLRPDEATALRRAVSRDDHALTGPEPIRSLHRQLTDIGAFEGHVLDPTQLSPQATADAVLYSLAEGTYRLAP